jgi:hypothetical protein
MCLVSPLCFVCRQGVGQENTDVIVQEILRHLELYNQERQQKAAALQPKGNLLFDFAVNTVSFSLT